MSKAKYPLVTALVVLLALSVCVSCTPKIEDAAGVRDAALEYLREHYLEYAPDAGLEWQEEDAPLGELMMVGITVKQFTSDGLTVTISTPQVSPKNIYLLADSTATITSVDGGWYWQGKVKPDGTVTELSPLTEMSEEWSQDIAEEFVKNSPTFTYDGIEETLELSDTVIFRTTRCLFCWTFMFEFDCLHAGYGNRTGEALAQVITPHEAVVTVDKGKVISAVIDRKWDMLRQTFATLDGTRWIMVSYGDPGNPRVVIEDTEITAEFLADEVSGSAGCNSYFGFYEIDGENMTIDSIGSTEMYCMEPEGVMDQETLYLSALGQAERFLIEDGTLEIFYSGGQILTFSAE